MKRFLPAFALVLGLFAVQLGASSYVVTPSTILADPTHDLQADIDFISLHGGGTLSLGAGTYRLTSGLVIPTGVNLVGSGESSTVITCNGIEAMKYTDMVTITGNDCKVSDLLLLGYGNGAGAGPYGTTQAGIRVASLVGSSGVIDGIVIERVVIAYTLREAIAFGAVPMAHGSGRPTSLSEGSTLVINSVIRDCRFTRTEAWAYDAELYLAPGCTTIRVEDTYFQLLCSPAAMMKGVRGITFNNCSFENTYTGAYAVPFIVLGGQNSNITANACFFENHGTAATENLVSPFVSCAARNIGVSLRDCTFWRDDTPGAFDTTPVTVDSITTTAGSYCGVIGTTGTRTGSGPYVYFATKALVSGCTVFSVNAAPAAATCVIGNAATSDIPDLVVIENSFCGSQVLGSDTTSVETSLVRMSGCVKVGIIGDHIKTPTLGTI